MLGEGWVREVRRGTELSRPGLLGLERRNGRTAKEIVSLRSGGKRKEERTVTTNPPSSLAAFPPPTPRPTPSNKRNEAVLPLRCFGGLFPFHKLNLPFSCSCSTTGAIADVCRILGVVSCRSATIEGSETVLDEALPPPKTAYRFGGARSGESFDRAFTGTPASSQLP